MPNNEQTPEVKVARMNSNRIKEIQETTAYPDSPSVMFALNQVWNECEQNQSTELERLTQALTQIRDAKGVDGYALQHMAEKALKGV